MYHELNARKVQPAGGDVGGDEDVALTSAEGRDGGVPGHLGEVAVKRGDGSAPNRALVLPVAVQSLLSQWMDANSIQFGGQLVDLVK